MPHDDESTDINIPIARPRESERPPESLTRQNIPAAETSAPELSFDDMTEVTDERPTDVNKQIVLPDEDSIQFSFSVPLGPNDTIIPTRPRGNIAAYDALVKATVTEEVDIAAFPDPAEFDVQEDAPTYARGSSPNLAQTRRVFREEESSTLTGADLEYVEEHAPAFSTPEPSAVSSGPSNPVSSAASSDTKTHILAPRKPPPPPPSPPASQSGISVELPTAPAYEIDAAVDPYEAHDEGEAHIADVNDANATLVPSKARYDQIISELHTGEMDVMSGEVDLTESSIIESSKISDDGPTLHRASSPSVHAYRSVMIDDADMGTIESTGEHIPIPSEHTDVTPHIGRPPPVPVPAAAAALPAAPAQVPIKLATYRPPALTEAAQNAGPPSFEVDQDAEERALTQRSSWEALIELYLSRIQRAPSWTLKAKLFAKIASVFEVRLDDPEQALDALMEAFDLSPMDEGVARGIERLAGPLDRWRDIVERAKQKLQSPMPEGRMAMIARVAHWYDIGLDRRDLAAPYLEQLEKMDRNHPLLMRRNAAIYREQGDAKKERDALERMLDAATRTEAKVQVLLTLASVIGTSAPEALKYFERAYSLDPKNPEVLAAIEGNGEAQEKLGQVAWALREQIAVARDNDARVAFHTRLASLYEKRLLRRELAAKEFEMVLAISPRNSEALAGLERCYRALQAWPDLARTLERRADVANDASQRIQLLLVAAEVYELKTQDTRSAIKCLKRVLGLEESHKRALDLLAKLSQKVEEWGDVAKYRVRFAELEPSPRLRAAAYAQLADLLSTANRDGLGALRYYRLAVETDPKNSTAWEALTREARASGDMRRLARVLEDRAAHVTTPRVRAQIFVELAETKRALKDEPGTNAAYDAAVQADRTNEDAAAYMLDRYVRDGQWKQAAPLCELLVNAAVRDQETTQLIGRLRLATRIAASQGDVAKAITAAISAYDARPDDPGARGDLLDLCLQLKSAPKRVEKAAGAIERIAMRITELSAPELAKLAQVMLVLGQTDEAIEVGARAIAQEPGNRAVTAMLADAYVAKGDWAGACDCKVSLARTTKDPEERFKRLCEAGEIWSKRAHDLTQAREVWEEALTIKERDRWLLHSLMGLYTELESWERLTTLLLVIAETHEKPAAKAKSLFTCAQICAEKIGDLERAAEIYDMVMDIDRGRLDAFEQIVRIHTTRKDWSLLERAYRKMIARQKDDGDQNLLFELWKQLGLIFRDRLGEAEMAREALGQADRLRPTDGEIRKMMTELDVVTDNLDNALLRVRAKLKQNAHDADLYSETYDILLRMHSFDRAWCAINVLAQFRELDGQAAQFYVDYPPVNPANIPGQITEEAWQSHLVHPALDPMLTNIFAVMTPLVCRSRARLPATQEMARKSVQLGPTHTNVASALFRAFRDACEILNLAPPELLAGAGTSSNAPFFPALIPQGALYVNPQSIETQMESLQYLVGKRLAEQRPELGARAFFPSVTELRALLAAAVRIAQNSPAKDQASQQMDGQIRAVLTWEETERLRVLVSQASQAGNLLDVKRWAQLSDLSSSRAGLLLSGDVTQARRAIQRDPQTPTDLSPRDRIGELYLFATSEHYADLRIAIGVAVGTET